MINIEIVKLRHKCTLIVLKGIVLTTLRSAMTATNIICSKGLLFNLGQARSNRQFWERAFRAVAHMSRTGIHRTVADRSLAQRWCSICAITSRQNASSIWCEAFAARPAGSAFHAARNYLQACFTGQAQRMWTFIWLSSRFWSGLEPGPILTSCAAIYLSPNTQGCIQLRGLAYGGQVWRW